MDNMKLWNSVCETDPKITKDVAYGKRKFTAIDAQHQRKRATELWGPYGKDWGLRELVWGEVGNGATPVEITLEAFFFYPDAQFPISSDIKWHLGEDNRKKLLTDVTTKALSMLGFNADVFEGKFDDNKYVQAQTKKHAPKPPSAYDAVRAFLVDPKQKDYLPAAIAKIATRCQEGALTNTQAAELHIEALIRTGELDIARLQLSGQAWKTKGISTEEHERLSVLLKEVTGE